RPSQSFPNELELEPALGLEIQRHPIAAAAGVRHRALFRHAQRRRPFVSGHVEQLRVRFHVAASIPHAAEAHPLPRERTRNQRDPPVRQTREAASTRDDLLDQDLVRHSVRAPGGYSSRISKTTSRRSSSEAPPVTARVPCPRQTTACRCVSMRSMTIVPPSY